MTEATADGSGSGDVPVPAAAGSTPNDGFAPGLIHLRFNAVSLIAGGVFPACFFVWWYARLAVCWSHGTGTEPLGAFLCGNTGGLFLLFSIALLAGVYWIHAPVPRLAVKEADRAQLVRGRPYLQRFSPSVFLTAPRTRPAYFAGVRTLAPHTQRTLRQTDLMLLVFVGLSVGAALVLPWALK